MRELGGLGGPGGAGENQTHDEGFANLGDLRSGSMSVIDAMFRQSNGQARVRVIVRHPLRQICQLPTTIQSSSTANRTTATAFCAFSEYRWHLNHTVFPSFQSRHTITGAECRRRRYSD